jgi:hypothetical protein
MKLRPGLLLVVPVLPLLLLPVPAQADDVDDQIAKAASAHRQHDLRAAITALNTALTLLQQERADAVKALLPAPPPGWTADAAETSSVSPAVLGGGTTASRTYHQGPQQVDVQFIIDSPIMQGLAAMISGPLAALGGIRTSIINGRQVAYTPNDNGLTVLVSDKVLVKVDGNKDTPEPTLRSFMGLIDFAAIEAFMK